MKNLSFFCLLLTATMFFGCGQTIPEVEVEYIELNKASICIDIAHSYNLVATIFPSNATNQDITWSSSDPYIAVVSNSGTVTGISEGNAVITATTSNNKTATCSVNVYGFPKPPPPLNGTNYYVIFISESTRAKINSKIVADFSPKEEVYTNRLWIWEDSYMEIQTMGVNSFGLPEGWMKFEKTKEGANATYTCYDAALVNSMKAISDDINNYYLHIAYKSVQPNCNTIFELNAFGVEDPQPSVVIGKGTNSYINKTSYAQCTRWDTPSVTTTFQPDGEWYHFDIPMTYFANQGLVYSDNFTNSTGEGQNIFTFRTLGAENPIGTTVEYDAVFIYKKAQ